MLVTGYGSTPSEARSFNNLELARRRAASVAAWPEQAGFTAIQRADYPVDRQALLERDHGRLDFQVVRVGMDTDQEKIRPVL